MSKQLQGLLSQSSFARGDPIGPDRVGIKMPACTITKDGCLYIEPIFQRGENTPDAAPLLYITCSGELRCAASIPILAGAANFRYVQGMELTVPDDLIQTTKLAEAELRFDLALGLYIDKRITLGRGAEIAGIAKSAFLDELGKRKLPINFGEEDFKSDLNTIGALMSKRARE